MHDLTKEPWVNYNYKDWLAHFKENDQARLKLDFSEEPVLTDTQRKLIFKSIKAFQMGEHSEGMYLVRLAEKFEKERNVPPYAETMLLFIKEENFHSAYLALRHPVTGERLEFSAPLPEDMAGLVASLLT